MPTKRFKQFLFEEKIKYYFIRIEPYTDDAEMVQPLADMMSWIKRYLADGQGIEIKARL